MRDVAQHRQRPEETPVLTVITLHLARTPEFPEGSNRHRYEIHAPLDAEGHLDAEAWLVERERCRVRRIWPGEPDRHGWLVHRAGGAGGATWWIDYDDKRDDDDEAGYRLGTHRFVAGDYVSFRGADGELQPFRIDSVRPKG
jgi:hypothetical protein